MFFFLYNRNQRNNNLFERQTLQLNIVQALVLFMLKCTSNPSTCEVDSFMNNMDVVDRSKALL